MAYLNHESSKPGGMYEVLGDLRIRQKEPLGYKGLDLRYNVSKIPFLCLSTKYFRTYTCCVACQHFWRSPYYSVMWKIFLWLMTWNLLFFVLWNIFNSPLTQNQFVIESAYKLQTYIKCLSTLDMYHSWLLVQPIHVVILSLLT